jgi:hypothetical protein
MKKKKNKKVRKDHQDQKKIKVGGKKEMRCT